MTLSKEKARRLGRALDAQLSLRASALREHALAEDPIQLVYPYHSSKDQEVAALLASCLAYGQRKVFVPITRRILGEMGSSPYEFVVSGDYERTDFAWFRYRFNRPEDLRCLFHGLRSVLTSYGSLESAFVVDSSEDRDLRGDLGVFVGLFRNLDFRAVGSDLRGSKGFRYLLPDPFKGGACKRLNMFLRWMVRKDSVDLGLWSGIQPSKLVIPLDVHVQRLSLQLGLTTKKGSTWKIAEDITRSLSQLDPDDPLKYDFLLFSLGAWGESLSDET